MGAIMLSACHVLLTKASKRQLSINRVAGRRNGEGVCQLAAHEPRKGWGKYCSRETTT